MDRRGLEPALKSSLFFIFVLMLMLTSCSTKNQSSHEPFRKSFFESTLPPSTLLILAEQYLEWQKGYAMQIRDHQQGLLVTEWIQDADPSERYRVTLRVTSDPRGSLLSSHIVREVIGNRAWQTVPSDAGKEASLVDELENYVKNAPAFKSSQGAGKRQKQTTPSPSSTRTSAPTQPAQRQK